MSPFTKKPTRPETQDTVSFIDTHRTNEGDDKENQTSNSLEMSPKSDQKSSSNESGSNSKSESSRTGTTEDESNMIKEELARQETRNVFRLRIVVIIILVAVAMGVSYLIYDITHKAEIAAFESEYEGNAELIIASLKGEYKDMRNVRLIRQLNRKRISRVLEFSSPIEIIESMSAVAGFAVTISVEAEVWPFVTLDSFHMQARNVAFLSGADYITLNPLVQAADLAAWESYVLSPANAWM